MSNSLDLPDLVIRNVLKKLDMNSILTLRKVNHRLRSFIDTEKPDYSIHNIIVTVRKNEDCIELFVDKKEPLLIEYRGKGQNTLVVCNGKELTINANSVKTCIKDLKIMVKNQKSMFEGFTISCPYGECSDQEMMNEFLGGFKNILTSREQKYRSRTLKMFVENQNQVMEVLPYLCPNTLQEVHLIDPQLSNHRLEIDEIIKLTHWRNLTYFAISGFYVNESIRKFSHLLEAYIEIQSATAEDVLYLKEKLIMLRNFKEMRFKCHEFERKYRLKEFFGPSNFETSEILRWEFVMQEENRQFCITIYEYETFSFNNFSL